MGAEPVVVLYASISVLNLMCAATWSQCREIKRGVTWAILGSLKTSRANAFWIICRGLIAQLEVQLEERCSNPVWIWQGPGVVQHVV